MLALSRWKIALVVLSLVLGALFTMPNFLSPQQREALPGWLPKQGINLGLDLQGGSYLMLEVDTSALKQERLTNLIEDVRTTLREERIETTGLGRAGDSVSVRISDPAKVQAAQAALSRFAQPAPGQQPSLSVTRGADQRLTITPSQQALEQESAQAVEQSIEIIRRRVDELGTREPSIARQGQNRIVLQAPGESDPERLKRVIGQTAKLTFQMVDDTVRPEDIAAGAIPPDVEILQTEEANPDGSSVIAVKKRALVTGEMLQTAGVGFDPQTNEPVVTFRFNGQGAKRFATATSENVGKPFAIVLDKKVISAPRINEPITGGSGQISGNFTTESANDLAVLLRAGALPAPLNVEEQRTVGAELGADAIADGQNSAILAFVAVLAFMILAYGFLFGGISIVALLVNGLLIIAAMSLTQASLTLPGIAGLILTLAVAVDANVLIYERMREEIRAGRSVLQAMDAGFGRAMLTIFDANVTNLGAAMIMFSLGAGPVKGFAWTLAIGVFTSVFTAVLITQVLLAIWFRATRPKVLPI